MNKTEVPKRSQDLPQERGSYKENITNLRKEINEIKEDLKELRLLKEKYGPQDNLTTRVIAIKKLIAEQDEYSRRETVELVGLPDNTNDGELEDAVIKTSKKRESK